MSIEFVTERPPLFEFVPVQAAGQGACPAEYRDAIVVDTVHDGDYIPQELLDSPTVARLAADGTLRQHYMLERDWGANLVAKHLSQGLGLGGYHRVRAARVVFDFNRFPGTSPPGAGPLERLAISELLSQALRHDEKRKILEGYYDVVSQGMEQAILGKLIKLSIHTYDEHNHTRTKRPEVSLLSRSASYQTNSRLPFGLFDPLFPDVLVESSSKRVLRDRIALTMEKAGIYVEHNYPYCLPDGSLEIRSQPWFYFQHVRSIFEAEFPETVGHEAYRAVWDMLLNTNLRSAESAALSGYLHRFQNSPLGFEKRFAAARQAYDSIHEFLDGRHDILENYRLSSERVSALCIEVRKDLLWRFEDGIPVECYEENASLIGACLARSIGTYLSEDRPRQRSPSRQAPLFSPLPS